jgi:D-aspartate ligase
VVFGLFETGLGVIRSLGQNGIRILGIDHRFNIGCASRYTRYSICPHPLRKEKEFIRWIRSRFSDDHPLPAFITQDDFLTAISRNRESIGDCFKLNMIDHALLESITDKYQQSLLSQKAGIATPATWLVKEPSDLLQIRDQISYPVIIKGRDVNRWRNAISKLIKVYLAYDYEALATRTGGLLKSGIPIIVQEIIPGPETNHYKYCSYINRDGKILAEFTLRKIRQNPVRFGFGTVVESIPNNDVIESGRKLLSGIGFTGIGSVEFKQDQNEGTLKLIEINPRYWQQNYLSTRCGVNFPYLNYLDLLDKNPDPVLEFKSGVKWINILKDFDSYLTYRNEGSLSYRDWRKSLKGKKVYSDFTWDDPIPRLYQFGIGPNLFKIPGYIIRRLRKKKDG